MRLNKLIKDLRRLNIDQNIIQITIIIYVYLEINSMIV